MKTLKLSATVRAATIAALAASLSAGAVPFPAAAQAPAPVSTPAPGPVQRIDPSLIPGLVAQMRSARAEAQAWLDRSEAAERELRQRTAEWGRWQAQIDEVAKARALFAQHIDAYNAAITQHNARAGSVDAHDAAAVAAYLAEGDQIEAGKPALEQERANYLARDDEIHKQSAQLSERMGALQYEMSNSRITYLRAKARADTLAATLAAQGVPPDRP